ncbi:MAG: excinuclease ABC subunit UvrA [Acidobacteriota bacterium]
MSEDIVVRGARVHNLKSVSFRIPSNGLTVVTGVSGSGKSSLAFDTLYAEGQRRYVESLSAYARQFLERIERPDVDEVTGISPAIAIRQKNVTRNPRSTVGTVTEIYDYLRLLFARAGITRCRRCGRQIRKDTIDAICDALLQLPEGQKLYLTFPYYGSSFDLHERVPGAGAGLATQPPRLDRAALVDNLRRQGFVRLLHRDTIVDLTSDTPDFPLEECSILVDRVVMRGDVRQRLVDSLEICYREGNGVAEVVVLDIDPASSVPQALEQYRRAEKRTDRITLSFSERFECQNCDIRYRVPEPRLFSFNNPYGACPQCQGFGNTINLDMDLIVPDPELSIDEDPFDPWNKPRYRSFNRRLKDFAAKERIPLYTPYKDLSEAHKRVIFDGRGKFPGIQGFFNYLDTKKYKIQVRIFISRYRGYAVCTACRGQRLRPEALDIYVADRTIADVVTMTIEQAAVFFRDIQLSEHDRAVADKILVEICKRLAFLQQVGLHYLTLSRLSSTLSGGEAQRIQLATSIGSSLVGALYVLDEPSIGLHSRDTDRLIRILQDLRDIGNTVVVVEHDRAMMLAADQLLDLGPGAGESGGHIIHSGDYAGLLANDASLTGRYLAGSLKIATPFFRRSGSGKAIQILGATEHNLKNIDVTIPLEKLVCITGVSGSGKSTLVRDVLYAGLKKLKEEWKDPVGRHAAIEGCNLISEVILVDQSPIGRTPRSNPVTYVKAFDDIRAVFAATRDARTANLEAGQFSFNIPGGRCETCEGSGTVSVQMQFLADIELTCEECKGTRFKSSVLDVRYKGKNIHEVLNLTVREALSFFANVNGVYRRLKVLDEVGLGYLRLGQSSTTLSGGEAQRIKLASFLIKKTSVKPLYIFDEPTTGLHFDDIHKLLASFDKLIAAESSLVVIEHNLDVVKCADWVIDLGPDGGGDGGFIVAQGEPEDIVQNPRSLTGQYLRGVLDRDKAGLRGKGSGVRG